jgi:ABC-type Na+ transport system ATPase subunit NatA
VTLVTCRAATKVYGTGRRRKAALEHCSFTAEAGEIIGVVGPNGAGKTTLLSLIAGELSLTAGELSVAGYRAGTRAARRAVGFAPDPPVLPPDLNGTEWLTYLASHRARSAEQRARLVAWAIGVAELEPFVARRIGTYSRGMTQRLGLAAAALARGAVLALDEVLSGVDPLVQRRLRLATRVLVLWGGRLVADVSTARLVNERVAELTLGGSALGRAERLLLRFPGTVRTGQGVAVRLAGGRTVEEVLATCREERIPVAASRVRYRALEDILLEAAARHGEAV